MFQFYIVGKFFFCTFSPKFSRFIKVEMFVWREKVIS
jgi:hypothetical protein